MIAYSCAKKNPILGGGGLLFWPFFPEKCMKMKIFGLRGESARLHGAVPHEMICAILQYIIFFL